MSVTLVINFQVQPSNLPKFLEILAGAKQHLPGTEGCSDVRVLQDANDPNRIKLMETWTSIAVHQVHFEAINASGDWPAIVAMMVGEPVREYYNDI